MRQRTRQQDREHAPRRLTKDEIDRLTYGGKLQLVRDTVAKGFMVGIKELSGCVDASTEGRGLEWRAFTADMVG